MNSKDGHRELWCKMYIAYGEISEQRENILVNLYNNSPKVMEIAQN